MPYSAVEKEFWRLVTSIDDEVCVCVSIMNVVLYSGVQYYTCMRVYVHLSAQMCVLPAVFIYSVSAFIFICWLALTCRPFTSSIVA